MPESLQQLTRAQPPRMLAVLALPAAGPLAAQPLEALVLVHRLPAVEPRAVRSQAPEAQPVGPPVVRRAQRAEPSVRWSQRALAELQEALSPAAAMTTTAAARWPSATRAAQLHGWWSALSRALRWPAVAGVHERMGDRTSAPNRTGACARTAPCRNRRSSPATLVTFQSGRGL